jgi:hypothetical protein
LPHDSIIPANGILAIPIRFLPTGERNFTAILQFFDSYGQEYSTEITGTSEITVIRFEILPKTLTYTPGKEIDLTVTAASTAQKMPETAAIRLRLNADSNVISYGNILSSHTNWDWNAVQQGNDCISAGTPVGTSAMPLGNLATIRFQTFLAGNDKTPVTLVISTDSPAYNPKPKEQS